MQISAKDIEFLVFLEGELQEIEAALNRPANEANFRVLGARARALLHSSESTLVRGFSILSLPLKVGLIKDGFLLAEQSEASPAVYSVELCEELSISQLEDFSLRAKRADTYSLAMPIIGFDHRKTSTVFSEPVDFSTYREEPILGIKDVVISRWQLVSFLSNKKGLSHYSETREKKWQNRLDLFWDAQISSSKAEEVLRGVYEILVRIVVELLNSEDIGKVRSVAQKLMGI